jgi:hypothetical protein
MVATGTTSGHVLIWQCAHEGAQLSSSPPHPSHPQHSSSLQHSSPHPHSSAPPVLLQACICAEDLAAAAAPSHSGSVSQSAGIDNQSQPRALPVCVALQEVTGLLAAGTTGGAYGESSEEEDGVFIWRALWYTGLHSTTSLSSTSTSHIQAGGSSKAGPSAGAREGLAASAGAKGGRQGQGSPTQWVLDAVMPLPDTVRGVAWLPSPSGLTTMLAVALASGVCIAALLCSMAVASLLSLHGDERKNRL